jgi:hypothetical protein
MAVRVVGFSRERLTAVRAALALIRRRLASPPGPMPGDLQDALRAILSATRPRVTIAAGGHDGVCDGPCGWCAGYRILLCDRGLIDPARLPALVFHELIHIARGTELDAETFENGWFLPAEGARPPTAEDWVLFGRDRYCGRWVRLDPRTGRVTDGTGHPVVTFSRNRTPGAGVLDEEGGMAKPAVKKPEKLSVKVTVEITGHLPRPEVEQFMAALSSVVNNHLENGGNGGT